jgi:type III secretory pathway component EscV
VDQKDEKKMKRRTIREFLSFAIMAGFFFIVFYINIGLEYKIFMAVLVFSMVFLLGLADETTRQVESRRL